MSLPRLECRFVADLGPVVADAEAWRWLPSAPLVETVTGESPRQRTLVQAAWTAEALRVYFTVEDSEIRATMRERDMPLYEEEVVEVFVDPSGDGAGYFEFELNPLGTVLDLVLRRTQSGYRKEFRWRCENLETAVHSTATGWCGEFCIPFASLGSVRPEPGAVWPINFFRIDRTGETRDLSAWSPTGAPNFHVPQRFGELAFTS